MSRVICDRRFGEKIQREARLWWYGHVRRQYDGYIDIRMVRMELPGNRKRAGLKTRFMDAMRKDMARTKVRRRMVEDRTNPLWRPLTGEAEIIIRRKIASVLFVRWRNHRIC